MERTRRRGLEVLLGLGLVAGLVLAVVLVWESFSGAFSDKITVAAHLSRAGDALEQGDIVAYRDVIVGDVVGATGASDGSAVARLRIDPAEAARIPADVTAVAVPESLFGATKIELVPPAHPGPARLRDGGVIAADRSPAAESLQTALTDAYTLLSSVHPAQLDAALSALAGALQGQGPRLNRLIGRASQFLYRLAPHLPELADTITSLATVTRELARNAPGLLTSVRHLLVVSRGVLDDRQAVQDLLAIAPTVVGNAQHLLRPATVDDVVTVLTDEVPVTAALAQRPSALSDTIHGFRAFADTFNRTLSSGPYLKANILLTGADFTKLFNVAAGQKGTVFQSVVNPPLYRPQDCPRYGNVRGPSCASSAGQSRHERLLTTGADYGGSASSVGSRREIRAVRSAAAAITGQRPDPRSNAVTDLLLGPLLRGTPTIVRSTRR